jgi:hypothetical protein
MRIAMIAMIVNPLVAALHGCMSAVYRLRSGNAKSLSNDPA